jgi:putative heme-binding domain-containing protein
MARSLDALAPLLDVLQNDPSEDLRRAAAIAMARFDNPQVPRRMLANWKTYSPGLRLECVNTLKSRRAWARMLLEAVGKGDVPRTDLTDQTILAISNFRDPNLQRLIEKVWGRFRPTPADLEELIVRMRKEMDQGTTDPVRGKQVFEKNCLQCHKFLGQGHDVGPNLDGAERSIEYLLINVLDPNRVVGQPYFTRVVLRKNGTLVTGLVHAEDGQTLTLKRENNVLEVNPLTDIEEMKTEPKSLMPEGLANNMTPQDFRDLVRYLMANPFITEVQVLKDPHTGFSDTPATLEAEPWKNRREKMAKGVFRIGRAPDGKPEDQVPVVLDIQELTAGPSGKLALDKTITAKADTSEPLWFQYVQVEINAPAEMKTRLLVGTNGPVMMKLWCNGELLQNVKDLRQDLPTQPDQRSIPITLKPGVNRLLIRYGNCNREPALFLRVIDSERTLTFAVPKKDSK